MVQQPLRRLVVSRASEVDFYCNTLCCLIKPCEPSFNDYSKIFRSVRLLRDRALLWAESYFLTNSINASKFDDFIKEFEWVFDPPLKEKSRWLMLTTQGNKSVSEFTIEFRVLADEAGCVDKASEPWASLRDKLMDELAKRDEAIVSSWEFSSSLHLKPLKSAAICGLLATITAITLCCVWRNNRNFSNRTNCCVITVIQRAFERFSVLTGVMMAIACF